MKKYIILILILFLGISGIAFAQNVKTQKGNLAIKTGKLAINTKDSSLVGYWKLNETTGTSTADSSGNGNTGTLLPAGSEPVWTSGKVNGALSFDGNDYVSAPHSPSLATPTTNNRLSWGCWFKGTGTWSASHEMLIDKEVSARYISVYNGELFASLQFGIGQRTFNSGFFPSIGEWYFVMVIWDGTYMRFYVNGVLRSTSTSYAGQALDFGTGAFYLGTYGGTLFLSDGLLDDVRIYNRALGAEEILSIYNAQK